MVYLRGTLHIPKLENAVNVGDANLKGKEIIQKVVYIFLLLIYFLSILFDKECSYLFIINKFFVVISNTSSVDFRVFSISFIRQRMLLFIHY